MHLPPCFVSNITSKLLQNVHIPVAIIISETYPWFIAQIVENVKDWRISSKESSFHLFLLLLVTFPKVFQEVHVFRNPVPPREDFI
jgi:hypothetical protein